MFKKPFNREVGELRNCKKCGVEYYTYKPVWQCNKCACNQTREVTKRNFLKKDNYPFNDKELYGKHGATKRFTEIRQRLNKCKTREEKTAHYDKQLKEIEENGVLKWILDNRSEYKKKKLNVINVKEYPNTKNINYDDYV